MSTADIVVRIAGAGVVGYLLGSLPSGVIVSKVFGRTDPRAHGSGKTGAANVLRTLGPVPAVLVALLDIAKGAAAILVTRYFIFRAGGVTAVHGVDIQGYAESLAGLAALLGHTRSIFIGFKGGRGVMTGAGALIVLAPLASAIGVVCGLLTIATTRYVSIGSMIGTLVALLVAAGLVPTGLTTAPHLVYFLVGAVYIIGSHADNITRLLNGTERKLGQRAD